MSLGTETKKVNSETDVFHKLTSRAQQIFLKQVAQVGVQIRFFV